MNLTIFLVGLACIIAAIVGGGLTMAGVTIPPLASRLRQALLALAGGIVVAVSFLVSTGGGSSATPQGQATQPSVVQTPAGQATQPPVVPTLSVPSIPSGGFPAGEVGIELSVSEGPPGTSLQVSGSGFAAGETVDIRFHTESLTETRADGNGAFSGVSVRVPDDWPFKGQFDIVATGRQSIRSARAPFRVR